MHGRRQGPEQVSTGFVFTALVLGLILTPFVKCGQAIGCVSEDFGKTKALVRDEGERTPDDIDQSRRTRGRPVARNVRGNSLD